MCYNNLMNKRTPLPLPSVERLVELFYYDFADCRLHWRVSRTGCRAGSVAGYQRKDGRNLTMVDGKLYYTHRLIYKFATGEEPNIINHIDGNKNNNAIENLESNTQKHNCQRGVSRTVAAELPLPPGVIMSHVWYRERGLPIPDEAKVWRK